MSRRKPWKPVDFVGDVDRGMAQAIREVEPSWDPEEPNWDSVHATLRLNFGLPPDEIAGMTQSMIRQVFAHGRKRLLEVQGVVHTNADAIVTVDTAPFEVLARVRPTVDETDIKILRLLGERPHVLHKISGIADTLPADRKRVSARVKRMQCANLVTVAEGGKKGVTITPLGEEILGQSEKAMPARKG